MRRTHRRHRKRSDEEAIVAPLGRCLVLTLVVSFFLLVDCSAGGGAVKLGADATPGLSSNFSVSAASRVPSKALSNFLWCVLTQPQHVAISHLYGSLSATNSTVKNVIKERV